jgi:hypothetical protein
MVMGSREARFGLTINQIQELCGPRSKLGADDISFHLDAMLQSGQLDCSGDLYLDVNNKFILRNRDLIFHYHQIGRATYEPKQKEVLLTNLYGHGFTIIGKFSSMSSAL